MDGDVTVVVAGAEARLAWYMGAVIAAALVGGALPLLRRWRDEWLHVFVAFGAGVFLGAIFLHLLPDVFRAGPPAMAGVLVLAGFLVVLVFERVLVLRHTHDCPDGCSHQHRLLGISSLVGLSVHSFTAGFGLGVTVLVPALGSVIFLAVVMHKAAAAFSLVTMFRLGNLSNRTAALLLGLFSLMTPAGAVAALPIITRGRSIDLVVPLALAAGTFLYVATMDILPEAFHEDRGRLRPFVAMLLGLGVMFLVGRLGA